MGLNPELAEGKFMGGFRGKEDTKFRKYSYLFPIGIGPLTLLKLREFKPPEHPVH